jgi:ubiquinone/menaquinone biosynthesis C-methylase UbiE
MDKPATDFAFRFMSFLFIFRDILLPRKDVLAEVGIKPGFHILDYGCGPGSYAVVAARLVKESGKVYALDIHPLAIQKVRDAASKRGLANIETILSDCATGLPDESIDIVLLYDTFHELGKPDEVLAELHRVLKPNGILSFSDHHMKENEIVSKITDKGLFRLSRKGKRVYNFLKDH